MADELSPAPLPARRVRELARLSRARERRDTGRWLLTGAVALEDALAAGRRVELVAVDAEQAARHPALLEHARAAGAELAALDARAAARLGDREHGPGLVAVVERPPAFDGALPPRGPALLVGLCGLQDPGNVGTLLRSARAFGACAALLDPHGADPGNPKVLRASAGAALALPLGELSALPGLLARARLELRAAVAPASEERAGDAVARVASARTPSDAGASRPRARSFDEPAAALPAPPERLPLLLGHETRGVDDALAGLSLPAPPASWSVPQEPGVESLNVAVAGSILMADWYRRWR